MILNLIFFAFGCARDDLIQCETIVTYESFGAGFIKENCQSCHSSLSENRYGAPENVRFDTEEDVLERLEDIYRVTLSEDADMPPSGGILEEDRVLLELWLICSEGL